MWFMIGIYQLIKEGVVAYPWDHTTNRPFGFVVQASVAGPFPHRWRAIGKDMLYVNFLPRILGSTVVILQMSCYGQRIQITNSFN